MSEAQKREGPDDHQVELLPIVDDIGEVRYLLEAAWMAVESLDVEEQRPLHALLLVVQIKLTAAHDKLNIARGAPVEDRDDD